MDYLPVQLALAGKEVLLVGGGAVASRKADLLARANARLRVVAPDIAAGLKALIGRRGFDYAARPYLKEDLAGAMLVVAATNDEAVNREVSEAAMARGLLVNVVDQPALSNVIMSSIVDRDPLLVAVSTGGAAPALARLLRARIEAVLPESLGNLVRWSRERRHEIARLLPEPPSRHRFWDALLQSDWTARFGAGDGPDAASLIAALDRPSGRIELVRLKRPDPDLVTLGAVRAMQQASLLLAERAIPEAILDLGRRDAERLRIGSLDEATDLAAATIAGGGTVVAIGLETE